MSLADKKSDPSLIEALKEVNSLGQTAGFEVAAGLTPVKGTPLIVSQLNTLIYLVTSLHQKVNRLEGRLRGLEASKGVDYTTQLDKLTADPGKLNLGPDPKPKVKVTQKYSFFKDPQVILKEEQSKARR